MAELDKFKRRMIRAVARLLLHEKKPEEKMWTDLKQETGCDCKLLWQRMRALTVKKLSRLLLAEDRVENIAAVAQLSHTDWLLYDLVLVHEKIDVISVSGRTAKTEYRPLVDLFSLVQRFEIESKSGDCLADAWSAATLDYNSKGRQVTPMLLQRRWYQLKEVSRDRFYKFWTTYRGNAKLLDKAKEYTPTALHIAVARRYPQIVVEPFPDWEEQIKNNLVILPEQFENKLRKKVLPKPVDAEDPDIVFMEPVVEIIDLDADTDSEDKSNDSPGSKSVSNIDFNPEITIKKEPLDDSCVDGLCNVKIVQTTHLTHEEESINFDDTSASKKHLQNLFRNVTENVEREESQIENVENDVAHQENDTDNFHTSDIVRKETTYTIRNATRIFEPDDTTDTAVGKILAEEKANQRKSSLSFLNFAKIDLAKVVAMVDDTGLGKQKKIRQKSNALGSDDTNNVKKSMMTAVEEIVDDTGLDKQTPRQKSQILSREGTNNVVSADNKVIVHNTGIDGQLLRQKMKASIGDETCNSKKSLTIDLEAIGDDTELKRQIGQKSIVPSSDDTNNTKNSMMIDLEAVVHNRELLDKQIKCRSSNVSSGDDTSNVLNFIRTDDEAKVVNTELSKDMLGQNSNVSCVYKSNVINSTNLDFKGIIAASNNQKSSIHEVQSQNENQLCVDNADDVIEVKTDNCAIKLVSDELLTRDIKTENPFHELPSEITLKDDEIEYVDDGIILLEDDDDDDNCTDSSIKPEPDDNHETPSTGEESSDIPKFDLKLLMDPVVYTTKIDHMNCLKFSDTRLISDVLLISNIFEESKPISKKSINVQSIKQADTVSQSSIVDEKRDNDDLFKKENIEDEYEDECDVEDECCDEIQYSQKIKMSSCLLQKPRNRSYNPIQLCKNPDFNTRLKRLTVGFLSSNRNRQFIKACKPMTIDLCKGFEPKLINGTLYLKKTRSVTTDNNECNNVSEQTVSVIPSAMPAQSLLDSTKINIDDLLTAMSTNKEHELNEKPTEKENLPLGRNKVISLPDMDYVRRINQKLLTAEVTPIRISNNGSCAPPVQLLSSHELAEHKARNIDIREDPRETASISKDKLDSDISEKSIEKSSQATDTDETRIQRPDPIRFEVFSHKASQEATPPIKIAQGKDHELRNIVEQRKNKTKGNQYNKLRKICLNPGQVPWRPFHSTTLSWSTPEKYPEPDKYDFLLTTDTLLKVLKLLAGKEVEIHKKDKNKAKKLQREFENEYVDVYKAGKDQEKQNEVVSEVDEIRKKKVKKPKVNIIEGAEKPKRIRKKKNNSKTCCWCREKMQFLKQGIQKLTVHSCPLPNCNCCCKQEFFSYINFKDTLPNKSSRLVRAMTSFCNQTTSSDLYFLHKTDSHKNASSLGAVISQDNENAHLKNLTETVVLSDDEDSNVTILTNSSTAQTVDTEDNSELLPNEARTNTNNDKMQKLINNNDQFEDLPTIKLKQVSTNTQCKSNAALCGSVILQDENIQLKNFSQKIVATDGGTKALSNLCVENVSNFTSDLSNIQTIKTNAMMNQPVTEPIINFPNETCVTSHAQINININNFNICNNSERLSPQESVRNTLCEYSIPTDQQYEKSLSTTQQQASVMCNQQSHIVIDGTKVGHLGPSIITQKMNGKDRVVYLNGQQISRSPTCSPIFLGKNKILLTSVKLPSKNIDVSNDNGITMPAQSVPDGVHLIMLPTGELTYTAEPSLEINPIQIDSAVPIITAVQQQLGTDLLSNLESNVTNVTNIDKNEVDKNVHNIETEEPNSNISEKSDTIKANAIDLNIQNPRVEENVEANRNLTSNNIEACELNISNRDAAKSLEETSPILEKCLKSTDSSLKPNETSEILEKSLKSTDSSLKPNESFAQNNYEFGTVSQNKENVDRIAESAPKIETSEEKMLQDQNEKREKEKSEKPNQNDNMKNVESNCPNRDRTVTIDESDKDSMNNSRKEESNHNIDNNDTEFSRPGSNKNLKDLEKNSQDKDVPVADNEYNTEDNNAETGRLSAARDSDTINNSRKTILSDLMAMSGISSEDVTPATTSTTCESAKQSESLYMLQSRTNGSDLVQLSPITSLDDLKYACDHNGKFYKLDLDTGLLVSINVCVKQKVKPISKRTMKMTFDPKSVIDLTDDTEIFKSKDHMNSREPERKSSFQTDESINSVKPLKMFKAIRPRILRDTTTKSVNKCDTKNCENQIKHFTLKRRRKQNLTNQTETKIDLVDSDGPVEEEYLLDSFDSDSSQENDDRGINISSRNNSDDSDDEPLAKKVMRNKLVAETLARDSGVADDGDGRNIDGYEYNITDNQVEPICNIENLSVDMPVNSETEPMSVDFLESDDETSQDDWILGV